MSGPRISSRIAALISRFRRDSGANIAVIFAIALVPIITMIGCATDYSLAVRMKAKMQSAADGASVASISQNSAGYLAATQMTTDGSVPAGVAEANNIFTGNVNGTGGYQSLSVISTVTKTRAALRSNVQFSAQVPTIFLNIIGYQYLTISGSSSASASLPLYLDFYLMLDVSGSMGLPSTDAEQTRLSAINPDNFTNYPGGCTLACHFSPANSCGNSSQKYPTNNACMGYTISRSARPRMRTSSTRRQRRACPRRSPACRIRCFPVFRTRCFPVIRAAWRRSRPVRPTAPPTASSCAPTRLATP